MTTLQTQGIWFSPLFHYVGSFYGTYIVTCDGVYHGTFDTIEEAREFVGDEEIADEMAGVFHNYEILTTEEF